MNLHFTPLRTVIVLLAVLTAQFAQAGRRAPLNTQDLTDAQADSIEKVLWRQLETTPTLKDSVKVMYNIFDVLYDREKQKRAGELLYTYTFRAQDNDGALEALRLLSMVYADGTAHGDSLMSSVLQRAEMLPVSPHQRETVTFIRLYRKQRKVRSMNDEQRAKSLHDDLNDFDGDTKTDLYRRIEMLFTIVLYFQDRSNSVMLADYLGQLEKLIKKLPADAVALPNLYYSMAAFINTYTGHGAEAVEADRQLLSLMDRLRVKYKNGGRIYRRFKTNRYTSYMRMLANYKYLRPGEHEYVYRRINQIADSVSRVRNDIEQNGVVPAYYAMSTGDYARAVPLLLKAIDNPYNRTRRFLLTGMLLEAAGKSGNDAALLKAYRAYLPMVEARVQTTEADRIIEHQVLLDVNNLEASNARLIAQNSDIMASERNRSRWQLVFMGALLLLLLVVVAVAYNRNRNFTARMRKANQDLRAERDNMKKAGQKLIEARDSARHAERQKSDFINALCHEISEPVNAIVGYSQLVVDSVDEKRRTTLEKFTDIIKLNADIIKTLVNDVLDSSELENSQVVVKNQMMSMHSMAELAAGSLRSRLQPGVTMTVAPMPGSDPQLTIDTDPLRAGQVLMNMISNAVKFTEKGSVSVLYGSEDKTGNPMFVVQDTGPGIPPDKAEAVFGRFEKLSNAGQGIGLGLYLCRLVCEVLGARICIDTKYSGGTRVVFVLPLHRPKTR